jgi:ligand-binding sensor domain-containing protein
MNARASFLVMLPLCLLLITSCNSRSTELVSKDDISPEEVSDFGVEKTPSAQIANYLVDIFEDSKGHLWFGTISKGVARYDGKVLTYLTKFDGLPDNRVTSIAEDKNGDFWFGTESGLVKYDGETFETLSNFAGNFGADVNRVTNVVIEESGDFWVGTWGGIFRYDGKAFTKFELPKPEVDTIWNQDTKDWTSINMIDRKGNVWFTVDAYGATKYDGESFTHFTKKEGLLSNSAQSVTEDQDGNLWFGTRVSEKDQADPAKRFGAGGLSRYDGKTFTHFPEYPGLTENDVYSIYADKSGNVWISTLSDGLYKFDGEKFTNYKPTQGSSSIPFKGIQSMLEDSKGNLWIGCSGGLFRLKGEEVVNITQDGPWE